LLKEASPEYLVGLDLQITEVSATGFKFKYRNNNTSMKAFNIFIPLELTYYFGDTKPCAPITVWGHISLGKTQ